MRSESKGIRETRLSRQAAPRRLLGDLRGRLKRSRETPGPPGDGAALLPMATVLSRSTVYAGRGSSAAVELDEIVAVRRSDGSALVLGYGSVAEEALYLLIDGYAGGGFAALMNWAGVQPESGFSYDPEQGLLIGPEGQPRLVVGRSGCRVRLTFETGRKDASADIAGVVRWGPSEG